MSNRSYTGFKDAFRGHIENRITLVPHAQNHKEALTLDAHQQEAMLELAIALEHDWARNRAYSIVHCCGAGKTVLEANIVGASQDAKHELGINGDRRDIVLTTERSLVNVVRKQFEALGFTDLGIWGNGEKKLDRPIIISTIQAMQINAKKLGTLLPLDKIDMVIGDEADNFLTEPRKEIVNKLDGALRIGLTATPTWRNGRDISDIWGPKIHHVPLKDGVKRGINTPPVWALYEADIDESQIKIKNSDYDSKTLGAALKNAEIHKAFSEIYRTTIPREQRKNFPTIGFVPNTHLVHQITQTMMDEFGHEGINVRGWTGEDTSNAQINNDIDAYLRGEIDVLILCEMGGRGLDLPSARFLIDGYPTLSPTKLEQRHGRVMRKVREGSPLHQAGFRKDYSIIAQIHPKSNNFRPICLPDILDGWEEAEQGKPMTGGNPSILAGAPWLEEVAELQKRIEKKNPNVRIDLIRKLDLYQKLTRFDNLPQADEHGFIYLPKNYGQSEN